MEETSLVPTSVPTRTSPVINTAKVVYNIIITSSSSSSISSPRWCPTTPTWSSLWANRKRRCRGDTRHTSPKRAPTVVRILLFLQLRTVRRYQRRLFPPHLRLTTPPLHSCQRARTPGSPFLRTNPRVQQRRQRCPHPHPRPTRLVTKRHLCRRERAIPRRRRS